MGLDKDRFSGVVNSELLCKICDDVLEGGVQISKCEHYFCKGCISKWAKSRPGGGVATCPVDRTTKFLSKDLVPLPRAIRNMLSELKIMCSHQGCGQFVPLGVVEDHMKSCGLNPKRLVPCSKGCGLILPKDELSGHDCLRDLRKEHDALKKSVADLKKDLAELRRAFAAKKSEKEEGEFKSWVYFSSKVTSEQESKKAFLFRLAAFLRKVDGGS